jgi:probable phosphoglycerate mutase
MKRTLHTAELLARPHGLKVYTINELRERSYGAWEGLTVKEINEKFPGSYQKYEVDPGSYSPPGGETGFEVGERVVRALASITERHKDCSLTLVAHEATFRILLCRMLGISVSDYRRRLVQSNAGLTIVEYCEGRSKLLLYNDTSHLTGLK